MATNYAPPPHLYDHFVEARRLAERYGRLVDEGDIHITTREDVDNRRLIVEADLRLSCSHTISERARLADRNYTPRVEARSLQRAIIRQLYGAIGARLADLPMADLLHAEQEPHRVSQSEVRMAEAIRDVMLMVGDTTSPRGIHDELCQQAISLSDTIEQTGERCAADIIRRLVSVIQGQVARG